VRFIKYLFDALLQRTYKQFTQGSAQDNLSQTKLLSLKFPIPAITEQKEIADIISSYDDLIENNRRRIQLLEQSARLLYKEWFVHLHFPGHEHTKIIDGVPEGWINSTVGETASFLGRGITPIYDDSARGIIINQKCIRNRMVSLELARRQSKQFPPTKLVQFGDVLINSTGAGTLGRVAQFLLSTVDCTVDSHVTIVRPRDDVPIHYFGLHLTGLESYIATLGRGATNQTELSKDDIAALEIFLPSSGPAQMFEATATPIFGQIRVLSEQSEKLRQARDILLPKLMNGEVAV
jgi:type I restriction enzyme, S subunit